jgi:hypothetical protein
MQVAMRRTSAPAARMRRTMRSPLPAAAPLLLLAAACEHGPFRWEPAAPATSTTAATGVTDTLPSLATLASLPTDGRGARCEASLRVVAMTPPEGAAAAMDHAAMGHAVPGDTTRTQSAADGAALDSARLVAVWWSVLPDSSARLVSARGTANGASWEPAVPVDTLDRGTRGCTRPAPSVAWTGSNRYVHVAYHLDAPEGAGVFYAHSMLAGRIYDADPQPIVYGPRLARAAVAARGDTVVVAYENPNTRESAIALAWSKTSGHGFVDKAVPVSGGTFAASLPTVAVDGAGLTVGWSERQQSRDVPMRRRAAWRR